MEMAKRGAEKRRKEKKRGRMRKMEESKEKLKGKTTKGEMKERWMEGTKRRVRKKKK